MDAFSRLDGLRQPLFNPWAKMKRRHRAMSQRPESPAGFETRPFGSAEEIGLARTPFAMLLMWVWIGAVFAILGVGFILAPSTRQADGSAPWWLFLFTAFGAFILVRSLVGLFVAESWIVGQGMVAQHRRLRLLGVSWVREFHDPNAFEIVHGVWKNGRGSTDELVLIADDRRVRILHIENGPYAAYKDGTNWWKVGQPSIQRATPRGIGSKDRVAEDEIAPAVLGLARYLSRRSGLPLTVTERVIPEPSSGD